MTEHERELSRVETVVDQLDALIRDSVRGQEHEMSQMAMLINECDDFDEVERSVSVKGDAWTAWTLVRSLAVVSLLKMAAECKRQEIEAEQE